MADYTYASRTEEMIVAKTRSRTQRQTPRPRPVPRTSPAGSVTAQPRAEVRPFAVDAGPTADENLAETYPYVRGDLARIVALAVILFGAILVAPYILK